MHVPQLIERKRDGGELTPEEIRELIAGFTGGKVADYQMSAWAMAVFFAGMTTAETAALPGAMRDSGRVFSYLEGTPPKIDKHSTGGVGDKVSLILAPLLACEGSWVPMVSGRGLGITGGTLDKLESIPGFDVRLSEAAAMRQLEKIGVFMAGQTADFCPADKRLYSLRDVTGTVPSQALIVASILSKKLAESLDRLVLDGKWGSGAFMKTKEQAKALAEALRSTALENGVRTEFLISDMNEPLGRTVGNALEVIESVEILQGRGPDDVRELTLDLAEKVAESSRANLEELLSSGAAWEKFVALVEAQGGDAGALERLGDVHVAPVIREFAARADGVVRRMDAGEIGRASVRLGAGRRVAADEVDFAVGFSEVAKVGQKVARGETLAKIHARSDGDAGSAAQVLAKAVEVE
ncbi:MAG: thymidine phosphorylase [Chthoniobacterales bacterium]